MCACGLTSEALISAVILRGGLLPGVNLLASLPPVSRQDGRGAHTVLTTCGLEELTIPARLGITGKDAVGGASVKDTRGAFDPRQSKVGYPSNGKGIA